jgi:hypothetical protein
LAVGQPDESNARKSGREAARQTMACTLQPPNTYTSFMFFKNLFRDRVSQTADPI